jgi:hypothetical protein
MKDLSALSDRELDVMVSKAVMGMGGVHKDGYTLEPLKGSGVTPVQVPRYSQDIAAAWTIVEKLRTDAQVENCWELITGTTTTSACFRRDMKSFHATAATLPRAICLAALKAAEYRVESLIDFSYPQDTSARIY